jgi:hypothetical protein
MIFQQFHSLEYKTKKFAQLLLTKGCVIWWQKPWHAPWGLKFNLEQIKYMYFVYGDVYNACVYHRHIVVSKYLPTYFSL